MIDQFRVYPTSGGICSTQYSVSYGIISSSETSISNCTALELDAVDNQTIKKGSILFCTCILSQCCTALLTHKLMWNSIKEQCTPCKLFHCLCTMCHVHILGSFSLYIHSILAKLLVVFGVIIPACYRRYSLIKLLSKFNMLSTLHTLIEKYTGRFIKMMPLLIKQQLTSVEPIFIF